MTTEVKTPKWKTYRERHLEHCLASSRDAYYKRKERAASDPEYAARQKQAQKQARLRENKVLRRLACIRCRCKKYGIPFDLTPEDVVIPDTCPVFGVPIEFAKNGAHKWSVSIDRIDPDKGYVKGNIQVLSKLANSMKQDATDAQLFTFATWVLRQHYERDVTVDAGKVQPGGNTIKDVVELVKEVKGE